MASKFQQKIKLMKKDEDGKYKSQQFTSAEFLPGPVMELATELQLKMDKATENNDMDQLRDALRDCYDFIGDVIFEGQFTGEEYLNGMDAREVVDITGKMLASVTAGYDRTYADQKK